MAGHVHAQAWQWLAEGQSIQARRTGFIGPQEWAIFPSDFKPEATVLALMGDEKWEFRVAPRTLTIAGVEIEAPLTEAIQGQTVYASDATGRVAAITFNAVHITHGKGHEDALANGRLFATQEAAKAAYDAITALLTGKDAA